MLQVTFARARTCGTPIGDPPPVRKYLQKANSPGVSYDAQKSALCVSLKEKVIPGYFRECWVCNGYPDFFLPFNKNNDDLFHAQESPFDG